MPLFSTLFGQTNTAVYENTNIQEDIAEIEEEIEDSKQQFSAISTEVAEVAKEALAKKTLSQYERY
jgi:predicted  nucleic acid-binding Zn-ribbon protein